ncbi:MAG: hypothetical protein M1831_000687 [Alyxoria varia]|nr:MAG: hypothetical protein M1831_000687 [Alyxoria varia]
MAEFNHIGTPFTNGPVARSLSCGGPQCNEEWVAARGHSGPFGGFHPNQHPTGPPAGFMPLESPTCNGCMNTFPHPVSVPSPPPSDGSGALSPHAQEWPPVGGHDADPRLSKRIRLSTWTGTSSPVLRPDGVRKKNAKFEIPEDRNLDTLDSLIKQAKTEAELKELKMQKRLLRNREAALHSRQKKKTHTEQLERQNAQLQARIDDLERDLNATKLRADEGQHSFEEWRQKHVRAEQLANNMRLENERLEERHKKEKLDLQREITGLRESLQIANAAARGSPLSSVPSSASTISAGYPDFGPMDLSMSGSSLTGGIDATAGEGWEKSLEFVNDFCFEPSEFQKSPGTPTPDITVH